MNKYKGITLLSALLVLLFLGTSCNKTNGANDVSDFPDIGLPIKNVNSQLKIRQPKEFSISKDQCAFVIVENITDSVITIEPEVDVKIFQKTGSEWKIIPNNLNYNGSKSSVPVKGGDLPNIRTVDMCPGLYKLSEPITLRIIITGTPKNIDGVQKAISFTDITVTP